MRPSNEVQKRLNAMVETIVRVKRLTQSQTSASAGRSKNYVSRVREQKTLLGMAFCIDFLAEHGYEFVIAKKGSVSDTPAIFAEVEQIMARMNDQADRDVLVRVAAMLLIEAGRRGST
jgi:phosphoserine phosphatase